MLWPLFCRSSFLGRPLILLWRIYWQPWVVRIVANAETQAPVRPGNSLPAGFMGCFVAGFFGKLRFLPDKFYKTEIVFIAILIFLAYTVATKNKFTFDDVSFSLLSIVYVGMGFLYFMEIREISLQLLFYSLFVIWATDSGAYFVGRAFGKRKLWARNQSEKNR